MTTKHDSLKSRLDLIPGASLIEAGHVMAMGAAKYSDDGWKTVPKARKRYLAALMRHACAIQEGELIDQESNLLHAAHIACNALILCWFHITGNDP